MTLDRDTPSPDAEIAALAGRQHGVVTRAQLLAHCSEATIRRRVRDGRLHRVHRGVYAVGHAGLSQHGVWSAAVLAAGDNAALSHLSVAEFWHVSRWPTSLTSVVSTARRQLDGVELHTVRSLDPRDFLVHDGIRVTTVARMLVDLTDVLTAHQLAFVIYRAEYWHRFNLAATGAAMARANGRRNLDRLERALELRAQGSAGTRSANEDAFLEAQTVEPLVNTKIEVDFHWPDKGRVVEVDGPPHRRLASQVEDARRDALLEAAGWSVERTS